MSFVDDLKWCPACQREVNYLTSPNGFYCIECGGKARLFRDRKAAMAFRSMCAGERWDDATPVRGSRRRSAAS